MFELPEAKRIRRDEIVSPSSSTRSSPDIIPADNEGAHARLGQLLAFDIPTTTTGTNQDLQPSKPEESHTNQKQGKEAGDDDEEEEFEFRLFSAPKSAPSTENPYSKFPAAKGEEEEIKTQKLKIRLRSPTPVDTQQPGEGRFLVPFRGWSYYATKPEVLHLSARHEQEKAQVEAKESMRRAQFEDVAVTSDEVLRWARTTETPGCHLPWRVFCLDRRFHRVPKSLLCEENKMKTMTTTITTATEKKKSKPGKKRRIILRTRAAAVAAAAATAAATANMTEAEKRNKKNRERKIKRRQKEREKKAAMAATATTATAMDTAGDSSD